MHHLQHAHSDGALRKPGDNSGHASSCPGLCFHHTLHYVPIPTSHSAEGPSTCSPAGKWQISVSSESGAIWQLHTICHMISHYITLHYFCMYHINTQTHPYICIYLFVWISTRATHYFTAWLMKGGEVVRTGRKNA